MASALVAFSELGGEGEHTLRGDAIVRLHVRIEHDALSSLVHDLDRLGPEAAIRLHEESTSARGDARRTRQAPTSGPRARWRCARSP